MTMRALLRGFVADCAGAMVVETAIAAPVLAFMALGSYDVARLVQRQQELQSTASEAQIIALATESGATADAAKVDDILTASLGFDPAVDTDKVQVVGKFLCNGGTTPVDTAAECLDEDGNGIASPYFHVTVSDTYTPMWTEFGVGGPVNLSVDRWVLVPPEAT